MDASGRVFWNCSCGYRDYDSNANYCSRCGLKRPDEDQRAEMIDALRDLTEADQQAAVEAIRRAGGALHRQEVAAAEDLAADRAQTKRARSGGRRFIGDQE
jgi:hypothetical protein